MKYALALVWETGLIYMGIEKPMIVGDNKELTAEFRTIKSKFSHISALHDLVCRQHHIQHHTDESTVRKDYTAVEPDKELAGLHTRGLKEPLEESLFIDQNGKKFLAVFFPSKSAPLLPLPRRFRAHPWSAGHEA